MNNIAACIDAGILREALASDKYICYMVQRHKLEDGMFVAVFSPMLESDEHRIDAIYYPLDMIDGMVDFVIFGRNQIRSIPATSDFKLHLIKTRLVVEEIDLGEI